MCLCVVLAYECNFSLISSTNILCICAYMVVLIYFSLFHYFGGGCAARGSERGCPDGSCMCCNRLVQLRQMQCLGRNPRLSQGRSRRLSQGRSPRLSKGRNPRLSQGRNPMRSLGTRRPSWRSRASASSAVGRRSCAEPVLAARTAHTRSHTGRASSARRRRTLLRWLGSGCLPR